MDIKLSDRKAALVTPHPATPTNAHARLSDRTSFRDEVTAVIVSFNSARVLRTSLPFLAELPHVIVVDNASTDASCAVIAEMLPHAVIVKNQENIGFGRANNIGLNKVTTPYALILNPDCTITQDNIEKLVIAAQRYPNAALLSPKLLKPNGTFANDYRLFPSRGNVRRSRPALGGDLCVDWVVGAAMLLNMALMKAVGFFDEWFFLFAEEVDLCLRVHKQGHAVVLVADAEATHALGGSSDASKTRWLTFHRRYYRTLSDLYLVRKHEGGDRFRHTMRTMWVREALKLPFYIVTLNPYRTVVTAARIWALLHVHREFSAPHCSTLMQSEPGER